MENELNCPFDFTSRCTMGRCDCKPKVNKNKYLSWEEFEKSCYHTQYYVIVPLLNRMKINKLELITKGKYDENKLKSKLLELYDSNLDKLKIN